MTAGQVALLHHPLQGVRGEGERGVLAEGRRMAKGREVGRVGLARGLGVGLGAGWGRDCSRSRNHRNRRRRHSHRRSRRSQSVGEVGCLDGRWRLR